MVGSHGGPKPHHHPKLDQQQNDNNCVFEGICVLLCLSLCCLWNVIVFCGPQNECILYRYTHFNVYMFHACASSFSTPPKISRIQNSRALCHESWGHWCNKVGEWVLLSKEFGFFVVLSCAQVFHTCFSSLVCCLVYFRTTRRQQVSPTRVWSVHLSCNVGKRMCP